jgi:hypothetical protein
MRNDETSESEKIILVEALKELRPLVLREHNIGTIGDRYPDSIVAFRVLGVIILFIGLFLFLGAVIFQGSSWVIGLGIIFIFFSISFISSTKKTTATV